MQDTIRAPLNVVIIEDEPLAQLRIKEYVERIAFLHLLDCYDSALKALPLLKQGGIDVLFLDIQLEGLSGIDLLQSLSNPPWVILMTAYEQYAIKAFELEVTDYLLKPFSFQRFLTAVMKIEEKNSNAQALSYLFVKTGYRLEKIDLEEIVLIEGARDYRKIICTYRIVLTSETFGELEKRLPQTQFCRVHKSFLVALSKIESVEGDRILIQKKVIPVSETYRKGFFDLLR